MVKLNKSTLPDGVTILNAECENLRSRILKELNHFKQKLIEYEEEPDLDIKNAFKHSIIKMFLRNSSFAAFKRNIIRENHVYKKIFNEYMV